MTECEVCSGLVDPEEPKSRQQILRNLVAGDLFHATSTNGASILCIATGIGETTINARRLLVFEYLSFDRVTGNADGSVIDSVAPLPIDIHNVLMSLDRRHRLGRSLADAKLTDAEKKALLFIADFYPANAL
jgi:hypothetical protein